MERPPPPPRRTAGIPELFGKVQDNPELLSQVLRSLSKKTKITNFQSKYAELTGEYMQTRDLHKFLKENTLGDAEGMSEDLKKLWSQNLGGVPLQSFQGSFHEATGSWFWGKNAFNFGEVDSRGYVVPKNPKDVHDIHRKFSRDLRQTLHLNSKFTESDLHELNLPFQSTEDFVYYVLRNSYLDCGVRVENGSYVFEKPDTKRTLVESFAQRLSQVVTNGGRLGDLLHEFAPELDQFAPNAHHGELGFIKRRFGNYVEFDTNQPNPILHWKNKSLLYSHADVESFLNAVASRRSVLYSTIDNAPHIGKVLNALTQEVRATPEGKDWSLSLRPLTPSTQIDFPKRYHLAKLFPCNLYDVQELLLSSQNQLINTTDLRAFIIRQGFKINKTKVISPPPSNRIYDKFDDSTRVLIDFDPYVVKNIIDSECLNLEIETVGNERWCTLRDCVWKQDRAENIAIETPILISEVLRKTTQPMGLADISLRTLLERKRYKLLDLDYLRGDSLVIKSAYDAFPSIMRDVLEPYGSLTISQALEEWSDRRYSITPPKNLPWIVSNHLSSTIKISGDRFVWRPSEVPFDVRAEKILFNSEPMTLAEFRAKWSEESGTFLDHQTLTTILTRPYACVNTNPATSERLISSQWKTSDPMESFHEIARSIVQSSPMLTEFQDRFAELTGRYIETDNLMEMIEPHSGRLKRIEHDVQFFARVDLHKELNALFSESRSMTLGKLSNDLAVRIGDDMKNILIPTGFKSIKAYLESLPEFTLTPQNKTSIVQYSKAVAERKNIYVTDTPLGLRISREGKETLIRNVSPRLGGESLGIEPGDRLIAVAGQRIDFEPLPKITRALLDSPLPYEVTIQKREKPEGASQIIADDFWKSRLHEVRLSDIQTLHHAHTGKFLWVQNLIETLMKLEEPQLQWEPLEDSFDFIIKSSDSFNQVSFGSMLKGFLGAHPKGVHLDKVHDVWRAHFKIPPPFATNSSFFSTIVESNLNKCQIVDNVIFPKPQPNTQSGTLESCLLQLYNQKESYRISDLVGALISHPSMHEAIDPREYLMRRFHYCLTSEMDDIVVMNGNRKYLQNKAERLENQQDKFIQAREKAINAILRDEEVQSTETLMNVFSSDFEVKHGRLQMRSVFQDQPWNPNLLELAVLIILDGKPFTRPEFFQAEFAGKFESVAPTSNLHRMLGLTGRRGKLNDGEVCYRARYPYVILQKEAILIVDLDIGIPNVSMFNILKAAVLKDLGAKVSFGNDLDGSLSITVHDKTRVQEVFSALKKYFASRRDGFSAETFSSFPWLPSLILEFQRNPKSTIQELQAALHLDDKEMNNMLREVMRRFLGIWKIETDEFGRTKTMEVRSERPKQIKQILDATQGRDIFKISELTEMRVGPPGLSREHLCRRFGFHSLPLIHDVLVGKEMFSLRQVQLRSFLAQYPNGFLIDDLERLWGIQFGQYISKEVRIQQIIPAFERILSSEIEKREENGRLAFRPRKIGELTEMIRGQKRRLEDSADSDLRKRVCLSPRLKVFENGDHQVIPSHDFDTKAILTAFCRAKPTKFSFAEFQSLYINIAGEPLAVPDLLPFFKSHNFTVAFDEERQVLTAIPPIFVVGIHGLSQCGDKRDAVVSDIIECTSAYDVVKIVQESDDNMLLQLAITQDARPVRDQIKAKLSDMRFVKVYTLDHQQQADALTRDLEKSIVKILDSGPIRASDFQEAFKSAHGAHCFDIDIIALLEKAGCHINSEKNDYSISLHRGNKPIVEDDRILTPSFNILPSTSISNTKKSFSRGIEIRGTLDKAKAHEIYSQLELIASDENKKLIIPVHIHGDQANFHLDAVMQLINIFRTSKTPILTYMFGVCDLPAVLLAANGTVGYRYLGPKTFVIFQDPKRIVRDDIEVRLFESLLSSLDVHNQQTRGFLLNEIRGHTTAVGEKFWTIGPEHALDLGLFDFVEMPHVPSIMAELRGFRKRSSMV